MAENSGIEWTDHTFNPWMGCTKVSPACTNCYAERDFDHRYHKVKWGPSGTRVVTTDANWRKPLKWNRESEESGERKRVFCASLADVFEDWRGPLHRSSGDIVTCQITGLQSDMDSARRRLFQLIDDTPNLDWLLLTKRPENVMQMWEGSMRPNVWLGISIENQEWADKRLPYIHDAKRIGLVATTFVSAEPLVGPVILQGAKDGRVYNHLCDEGIDWVIAGGESGPDARPTHPDWFRSLRDQCETAGVAFHFKQWGEWGPIPPDHGGIVRWVDAYGGVRAGGPQGQAAAMSRCGKKSAGRLLDGVKHDGLPRQNTAA